MAWTTAVTDLRALLSDGDKDKLRHKKRCLGIVNGSNKSFKTFEFRRVTDFTTGPGSTFPFGVFIGDSDTPETITADFPETGHFQLTKAPIDGTFVEATYYTRYFFDSELQSFLTNSARWLLSTDDYTNAIQSGLQSCALKYAAHEAYQKLSIRFHDHLSDTYRMEDSPDDDKSNLITFYGGLSTKFRDLALKERDEFYTRQGQSLQPLFQSNAGHVTDVAPRR